MTTLAPAAMPESTPAPPHESAPARRPWRGWIIIALALILLAGAALRVRHLRQPYIDVFSWRQASVAMMADNYYRTDWNIFFPEVSWTGPGPNYQGREFQTVSYLAALLYTLVGQQDWVGRGISIAFSLWGIFAFYCLVRRVWDEAHGLAGAAVLAILPGAAFTDRSFLPDPAMLALTITMAWLFVTWLQTERRRYLVLAAIIGTLALLTKLPGIITFLPLGYAAAIALRRAPGRRWKLLRAIGLALICMMVPIAMYYAWAVYLGTHYPPYHIAGAANWLWKDGLGEWLAKDYFLDETLRNFWYWMWTPLGCLLAAAGLLLGPPRVEAEAPAGIPWRGRWFFHYWALGLAVLYAIGARELTENPWNFHVFNAVAAGFAGHALVLLARAPGRPARIDAAVRIGLVLTLLLVLSYRAMRTLYKPEHAINTYRMGLGLRQISRPGDLVVTISDDVGDPIGIYYSQRRGWVFPPAHMPEVWKPWNLFPTDDRRSIRMFEDLRERGARWLGIVAEPRDDSSDRRRFWTEHARLVDHIRATCEFIEKNEHYMIYRIRSKEELAARAAAPATTQSAPGR